MSLKTKKAETGSDARRSPRQQRAKMTAESIKMATLDIASKKGFSDITIAEITERAGVSKGSFYQYYSNRDAIYLSLYEDASATWTAAMKDLYVRILDLPVKDGVSLVLRCQLELARSNRLVLLVMPIEVPELDLARHPITYGNLTARFVRGYIEEVCPHLSKQEALHKAFFIHKIAKSCIYGFVNEIPENMSDKFFIDTLSTIIANHLTEDTGNA
ncbi:MAG: TetR/AcrR family transcriptional regulator [Porticoccaceae bacterium]